MGLIADGLRDLLDQMKESDHRLQEHIDDHVVRSSQLLDEMTETTDD